MRFLAGLAVAASLLAPAEAVADSCALQQIASLDLGADMYRRPTVQISIADHPVTALVDTGGLISMVTEATASDLALSRHPIRDSRMVTFKGEKITTFVDASNVRIGALAADRLNLSVMPNHFSDGVGATLAPDIMRNYDVELDYGAKKFNLFLSKSCDGAAVYWTKQPGAIVPLKPTNGYTLLITLKIDGKEIPAIIDTGSGASFMPRLVAERYFGLASGAPSSSVSFSELSFEGVSVSHPEIQIPDPDANISRLIDTFILGNSILRRLHLYIAYKEQKIYITAADAR
jgi:predicted aspartyl protease